MTLFSFFGEILLTQYTGAEFTRAYYYPSLDVADLDTVDEGVFDKVPFEMAQKSDWRLLIGHMLGVDHCGHTFGSLTHHIGEKLLQIDSFIEFGFI